jgi:amino acid adenylation domain-containing protein
MTTVHDRHAPPERESPERSLAPIPVLVAERAQMRPDDLAIMDGARPLTYRGLDHQAGRLAAHLQGRGVVPGSVVGLCLPRSLEMVIGALGILKSGAAYLPMDPAYPAERQAFMLDDAGAPALITAPDTASRLPKSRRSMVYLDAAAMASYPATPLPVAVTPADLAYVIYTSGSTGKPKGVELTHAGLSNLVAWHNEAFAITADDRASHLAGLGFDAAVWELWPYLARGASVHLVDETTRASAEFLRDWLVARRITVAFVPTPLAERLLLARTPWPRDSSLRLLLTGGDALHQYPPPGLPFTVINNYGPTECTVVATSGPISPAPHPSHPPPIGKAISNTRIRLVDERFHPVQEGKAGQLCIGGPGLARGYRNRPELTATKFIPDPFADEPGARLYLTGDQARQLPDGQYLFLGRMDDQIKIRGYRVEPEEIVYVLNQHPDVRECLVVARQEQEGKRLVAYVVATAEATLTHTGLRDFLRASLPEYMLPTAFVVVDDLPLTPHGKIDRAALPEPTSANTLQDEVRDAPLTETEQRVAEIVGELLNLDTIDIEDNFFMLGGHSLLGAQLIARLRQAFGVEIALRSLFEAPTVAALASEVDRLGGLVSG